MLQDINTYFNAAIHSPKRNIPEVVMEDKSPFLGVFMVTGTGLGEASYYKALNTDEFNQKLKENKESILLAKMQDEKSNGGDSDKEGVGYNLDLFIKDMLEANAFLEENAIMTFDNDLFDASPNWSSPGQPEDWNPKTKN